MNPKCRQQLNAARVAAGGKPLSAALEKAIDDRMSATMRRLARSDPHWQSYTPEQRLMVAAQQAAGDLAGEAARKVQNAQAQALKTAELEQRVQDYQALRQTNRSKALVTDIEQTNSYIEGVKRDSTRHLFDLIDAADSQQGASAGRRALMVLFDAQNPLMTRDLALEVFAQGKAGTGNSIALKGAQAWLQTTEQLRQRFNAAGGDVGRLDYGYLPQAHDQAKVLVRGRDQWANETLPLVDRSRYVDDAGARLPDSQVLDILRGAWDTISSDGANKTAPGAARGAGARANRGSQSREIHFKDGQAYLQYLGQFGTGSMYDAMIGHLGGLAKDIGLVERYGPNPEAQMKLQFDLTERSDGGKKRVFGNYPDAYWRVVNGTTSTAVSARVANIGSTVRNIETFGKLQCAVLQSVTDLGTYFVSTGFNKLSYWDAIANLGAATTKDTRDFLNTHGMIAESMISDLSRWTGENIAQSWSGKVANSTMRLSLMNAWTDTLRRAFSLTMMEGMGRMRSTDWGDLTAYDRDRIQAKGLTQADWELMQQAQPVQFRGAEHITPDAIYATGDPRAGEVVAKYLGLITDESEYAILNPDVATRAIATAGGRQRGTIDGELWRSAAQFKSFPIAMVSRHWRRMLETPQGLEGAPLGANRAAYAGAMMVSLTAMGAIAFQTKQVFSGKDPVDMTTTKFWTRALAGGGGLGFVGDMLLQDTSDDRSPLDTFGRTFLGPGFGTAADLYALTKGNYDQAQAGKDTHIGAESLRFARSHLPLLNLWYAKAALDHMGLYALQENLSPGFMARMQGKARKDWGQEFWLSPDGDVRAPNFAAIAGQ